MLLCCVAGGLSCMLGVCCKWAKMYSYIVLVGVFVVML